MKNYLKEKNFDIVFGIIDFVIAICVAHIGVDFYRNNIYYTATIAFIICVIFIYSGIKNFTDDSKKIQIVYHADIDKLNSIKQGDLIDLRAAEDIELKQGEFRLINLGVSMKLPSGYKANVYPRSSTYKNFGVILANSVGQIDESYCGNDDIWMFPAIAMRDTVIHKNDRIAQFEIVRKQPRLRFIPVNRLADENRGGIGSTGVK